MLLPSILRNTFYSTTIQLVYYLWIHCITILICFTIVWNIITTRLFSLMSYCGIYNENILLNILLDAATASKPITVIVGSGSQRGDGILELCLCCFSLETIRCSVVYDKSMRGLIDCETPQSQWARVLGIMKICMSQ